MSDTDWGHWSPDPTDETPEDLIDDIPDDNSWPQSSTSIEILGDYELMKIFGYFKLKDRLRLGLVCRKWSDCVNKSFKSETLLDNRTLGAHDLTSKHFCLIVNKCSNVKNITLYGVFPSDTEDQMTDNIVDTIVSNCTQLQSMDFTVLFDTFDYFEAEFIKNANFFKNLKKIVSRSITENAINSIIDSPNLEIVDISRNDKISQPNLHLLGPKITELNLIDSQVFDVMTIKGLCSGNGRNIIRLMIDIRDGEVLTLIGDNLKQLERLKVSLFTSICDIKAFQHLNKLKILEFETTDSSRFSEQDFIGLVRSLKETKLTELTIELSSMNNIAITDESLQELRKHCVRIEKLVIRGANSLTGSGMYAIAQMKYIRHLDLKDCLNITDQIDIVITSCPLLRELVLHNCSYISNSTAEPFIERAKTSPKEKFYLDVIDTNVSMEGLKNDLPKNLTILSDYDDCIYDCQHGWPAGHEGDFSGPEDMDVLDNFDIDFYDNEEENDYYDDYNDDYGDGNFDDY